MLESRPSQAGVSATQSASAAMLTSYIRTTGLASNKCHHRRFGEAQEGMIS